MTDVISFPLIWLLFACQVQYKVYVYFIITVLLVLMTIISIINLCFHLSTLSVTMKHTKILEKRGNLQLLF